ncbi:neutral amino acid transport system ATP-binding protein [Roseomonas rosea]|uniref:Neutral amino acid transport system ATP-binding protein n=1 Tax=Muricoccus roseus TaxID=198092 RepID=A0A1M6CZY2_9PROT|nr:ABC transporter ATP-binding protein [Roseomonas rosea]SHI66413.1 neutral amino acid transport system ATP-binding protein [Roseomonas rosea]
MGLLTVSGVVAGYSAADQILKGLDFRVDPGEIVCIVGPNGAGKSTLLKAVAGLLRPSAGSILLKDRPIAGLRPREVTKLGIAYVPQEHNVFPSMTVRENLEMGGYADPAAAARRLDGVMERFPVLGRKRRQAARTLSGGERQILAMGMALMVEPAVLLLDEPSAGLSPVAAQGLFAEIQAINRDGVAIALVEQNANDALEIAHRAYILVDGRNRSDGIARELAADPEIRRIFLGG